MDKLDLSLLKYNYVRDSGQRECTIKCLEIGVIHVITYSWTE